MEYIEENMNDEEDTILENDTPTTLNDHNVVEVNVFDDEMPDDENLDDTTIEDIILNRLLGQKSNGVITRSKSIRHQDELYDDTITFDKLFANETIDLDDDDVDIIDTITNPSQVIKKKGKKRNLISG
jgi:hypothetical protein